MSEPTAEAERVRLEAGCLVLSEAERAHWLGPDLYAGDAVALDLALMQAAAVVQQRGPHGLYVQVARSLAHTAQTRRDQDRRYREARASGGQWHGRSAPAGAVPGHRPHGRATRASGTLTHGGGAIYDRHGEDLDAPRWYALTSPEGQAYRAHLEAESLDADLAGLDRRGGLKLRPSAARRLLATGRMDPPRAEMLAGDVLARTAQHLAARTRAAGRGMTRPASPTTPPSNPTPGANHMTKASSPKTAPHLLPLKRVAREIGVSRDTITRHPAEFFPVIKLGHKRFVASAAYAAWLATHLPGAADATSPAIDGAAA
jgi:hypothetical protein